MNNTAPTNLDRSLAFTALLELWPEYGKMPSAEAGPLVTYLVEAFRNADPAPKDFWAFAKTWIAERRPEWLRAEAAIALPPKACEFVREVAGLSLDMEVVDGETYVQAGTDAIETLQTLIGKARALLGRED